MNVSDQERKPCACGCTCSLGPPETAPTWDIHCRPVERIAPPGVKLAGEGAIKGGFAIVTCGCADCKALYAQLTSVTGTPITEPAGKPSSQVVRAWAARNGIDCPKTGRVPAAVTESYLAAH